MICHIHKLTVPRQHLEGAVKANPRGSRERAGAGADPESACGIGARRAACAELRVGMAVLAGVLAARRDTRGWAAAVPGVWFPLDAYDRRCARRRGA